MYDVWVSGAFDEKQSKPAMGAWICPEVGAFAVTKRCRAISLNDGLRVGSAMAILSAINSLGEDLVIHIPEYPNPRWVIDPRRAVPLHNLLYRLLYRTEVHPRLESKTVRVVLESSSAYGSQLHALLTTGEVPKGCTL